MVVGDKWFLAKVQLAVAPLIDGTTWWPPLALRCVPGIDVFSSLHSPYVRKTKCGKPSMLLPFSTGSQESKYKTVRHPTGMTEISTTCTNLKDTGTVVLIFCLVFQVGPSRNQGVVKNDSRLPQTRPGSPPQTPAVPDLTFFLEQIRTALGSWGGTIDTDLANAFFSIPIRNDGQK